MSMFRKPSTKYVGLKVLVLGEKGVGKSLFSLSFPKSFALDAEAGMAFYEGKPEAQNLLGIVNTQGYDDLMEAIDEIGELVEEDENAVGTLIIDSETKVYQNLQDAILSLEEQKAIKKGKDVNDSNVSVRGWGRIKAVAQRLANLKIDLSTKGVNIISVSQIDDIKTKAGDQWIKTGEKPVMQKGSEYDYDVVVKLFTEENAKGETFYKGVILKDRTKVTKVNQIIENPSYDIWKKELESRKGADKITSSLTESAKKVTQSLIKEDEENEKTTVDKIKDFLTTDNEELKKAVLEEIKESKVIKNPLEPKNEKELKALQEIVDKYS